MPTLYHSPHTRSSRVLSQLMLMGKLDQVTVAIVDIVKSDGSGRKDPNNAHPEGKVPFLVTDDGGTIRESSAIMMYLDEIFGHPFSIKPGAAGRGSFLSWMSYYCGVLEPAMVAHFAELDHPILKSTFRTMTEVGEQIASGMGDDLFLVGDKLTIADIIMASAFQWAPHLIPEDPTVKAWIKRVEAAQDGIGLKAFETQAFAALKM
ncbi:glutathione S-transferase family protein [Parasedimentitalea marina]|uniref:Glutathione S-transferase family protein n=1 Tax=Parasedimentitalea marina TaxID=2483033 RepID=A0A3T0N1V0_9RHOB|nr:glutathione S-transferase family protein [Parasedimentitalea marina]AZV77967.1 glutathione S-transferase family protein [Parasedimentitalea marina]